MHNMTTWDHKDPAVFRATARSEILNRYETARFVDKKVVSLYKKEEGFFEATDDSGTTYQGKKVILATGSEDIYPKIPGYEALWGDLM